MIDFSFKITKKDKKTKTRLGVIKTRHGVINTPAFVPVGTQASVKSLSNQDLKVIKTQIFFVNTYHQYLRPGLETIREFGGLHNFIGWQKPLITDSAGFQIFSLGSNHKRKIRFNEETETSLVKIDNEGVVFRSHLDGSKHFFTPEKSIEIQGILGADLVIAFDECTFYPATEQYSRLAMARTHRWAKRCLDAVNKLKSYQALYGVVQGGIYKDLRRESASYISSLPFSGIAIGGVSVGESKKEMQKVLDWVIPCLDEDRPRHLLGVGEIDDIFTLVENGIDSFDCVMPSRLGRMGQVLVKPESNQLKNRTYNERYLLDINKSIFAKDKNPIDSHCDCWVCKNHARAYLHHLFRTKELLGYRLATFHNLFLVESLVAEIRSSLAKGTYFRLKKEWV